LVFPELNFDQIDRPRGLEISLVTDTSDSKLARVLLEELGFPFKKDG
jgi:large subunit ribosomal protein L5